MSGGASGASNGTLTLMLGGSKTICKKIDFILKTFAKNIFYFCLLYTSPSPRDRTRSRMPSSA